MHGWEVRCTYVPGTAFMSLEAYVSVPAYGTAGDPGEWGLKVAVVVESILDCKPLVVFNAMELLLILLFILLLLLILIILLLIPFLFILKFCILLF